MQHHVVTESSYLPDTMGFEDLGPRLKRLRKERGRTQTQVGEVAGVSRQQVDHIESGRRLPTLGTLDGIAEALGRTVHISFPGSGEGDTVSVDIHADVLPQVVALEKLTPEERKLVALLCEVLPNLTPEVVGMLRVQLGHLQTSSGASRKVV